MGGLSDCSEGGDGRSVRLRELKDGHVDATLKQMRTIHESVHEVHAHGLYVLHDQLRTFGFGVPSAVELLLFLVGRGRVNTVCFGALRHICNLPTHGWFAPNRVAANGCAMIGDGAMLPAHERVTQKCVTGLVANKKDPAEAGSDLNLHCTAYCGISPVSPST